MSEDAPPTSRKEKKAQRDAERHKGGKKRKRDETEEEQAPIEKEQQQDFIPLNAENGTVSATAKKSRKKERNEKGEKGEKGEKRKKEKGEKDTTGDKHESITVPAADQVADPAEPKPKKRKKSKSHATQSEGAQEADSHAGDTVDSPKTTKPRFILFIGNLPYSTTDSALQTHFKKITPFTLRHRTDPDTKKSKGFAFLEFENFDRMKTCLKLYHHTMFDPANPDSEPVVAEDENEGTGYGGKKRKGKSEARRINVELTAGGGGSKAEGRKEKIKAKNVRLDEQRKRRADAEKKEREKEGARKGSKEAAGKETATEARPSGGKASNDAGQIHPSRLARVVG